VQQLGVLSHDRLQSARVLLDEQRRYPIIGIMPVIPRRQLVEPRQVSTRGMTHTCRSRPRLTRG
jgi:hypothetical protein